MNRPTDPFSVGAFTEAEGKTTFRVWAPYAEKVELYLTDRNERVEMEQEDQGYWRVRVEVKGKARYLFILNEENERPDPASRSQPEGVHGPSEVVEPSFSWTDGDWKGLGLRELFMYEMHVGTFSGEGTFEGIIPFLDELKELGVTALELMPVSEFPGHRNWGYDGVFPFAVEDSYGGVQGLKSLVDQCHARGLAVFLDVVYNHLGPEGNYLSDFGPYFTDRYQTPWGRAINFDGPESDHVRRYFLENARYWVRECHVDGLRLDAVHAIFDFSAYPFLTELGDLLREEEERTGRRIVAIAESSLNDPRVVEAREKGGWGLDAQWNDDFHHAVHTLLTGENDGYYVDYRGATDMAKVYRDVFRLDGSYSEFRRRRHGAPAGHVDPERFVVSIQNHDQTGNRREGDRLTTLVDGPEDLMLAAALMILSPYQPLLFMGEEYGEVSPFLYFVSHSDPDLVEAVRKGRKEEFQEFEWQEEPPDPQSEETFLQSKLNHRLKKEPDHRRIWNFYRELLHFRKASPAYGCAKREQMEVEEPRRSKLLLFRLEGGGEEVAALFNLDEDLQEASLELTKGEWERVIDSSDGRWREEGGAPASVLESEGIVNLERAARSVLILRRRSRS